MRVICGCRFCSLPWLGAALAQPIPDMGIHIRLMKNVWMAFATTF